MIHPRKIRRSLLALSVVGALVFSGTAWAFNSPDYFPLTQGITWTYTTSTVTVSGTQLVNGASTTVLLSSTGGKTFNTSDASGIRLHGQFTPNVQGLPINLTLTFGDPIVLANASANVGDSVPSSGTAHFAFSCGGTADLPYTATFTITDPPDVIVPAGTFASVVQLDGTIHVDAGQTTPCGLAGNIQIPTQDLSFTFYLALNLGTVKLISGSTAAELTASNILLPNVSPTSWNYGNVGTPGGTSDKTFTVQNSGPVTLNGSATLVQGGGDFTFLNNSGGAFSLAPGGNKIVTVRFAPTSQGPKNATLRVSSSDFPGANPKDVPLSGTGVEHTLTINPPGPGGSPNPVASSGAANLSVAATDSLGHPLTYTWTASCPTLPSNGSAIPSGSNTTWTAPANTTGSQQNCTIQVTVNDGILPPVSGSYLQGVSPQPPHTLTITPPGPGGSPNPVASSGSANLSVTANDTLGHALFYAWTPSCPALPSNGSFNNAALRTPTWTAPANTTGSQQSCNIQVIVNDGAGGLSQMASYSQGVSPQGAHTLTITNGPSGSPDPVASGGTASLGVTANDTLGHTLSYGWQATCPPALGGNGSFSPPNANVRTPMWTAPANTTGSQQSCLIQVTVNDGAGGLSTMGLYNQEVDFFVHEIKFTSAPGGTPNPVASGDTANLSVTAIDTFGHALTYAWTADCPAALVGDGSFNDATLQTPTWTAPANTTGSQLDCDIQVTVSDGQLMPVTDLYPQSVSPEGVGLGEPTVPQLLNVMTLSGPGGAEQQTFLTTDPILAEVTFFDPNPACADVAPVLLQLLVFNQEGQLILTKEDVTSAPIAPGSKYRLLSANLAPGALTPGAYTLIFLVRDCTGVNIFVSSAYAVLVVTP